MEDEQATPASAIQKAFAVIASLQGEAACYILLQTYVPGDVSEAGEGFVPDDASERASVITATSSQNLVTHVRANTAYDPALGLGERHKDGSFRCAKAEHPSLDRRLQEETLISLRG